MDTGRSPSTGPGHGQSSRRTSSCCSLFQGQLVRPDQHFKTHTSSRQPFPGPGPLSAPLFQAPAPTEHADGCQGSVPGVRQHQLWVSVHVQVGPWSISPNQGFSSAGFSFVHSQERSRGWPVTRPVRHQGQSLAGVGRTQQASLSSPARPCVSFHRMVLDTLSATGPGPTALTSTCPVSSAVGLSPGAKQTLCFLKKLFNICCVVREDSVEMSIFLNY